MNWTPLDFLVAAVLLACLGLAGWLLVSALRRPGSRQRLALGLVLLASLLMFWVNGAVGIVGSEQNDINMLYLLPIGAGAVGSAVVRLRPAAMAAIWALAGITVFVIGLAGLVTLAAVDGLILSTVFAGLYIVGAHWFRRAGQPPAKAGAT
ncbi:hypothetical protein [Maricaulis sp.]|uniref:hypothetical protein n=1 Tax=Maricaulis sp. TaxID=1486257 RepID=UPI002B272AE9|nr:hypothetical protein [Maricaulis sp.]